MEPDDALEVAAHRETDVRHRPMLPARRPGSPGSTVAVVELVTCKWGGLPHYAGPVARVGEDEHGIWLWRPEGTLVRRGDEVVYASPYPSLSLVVRDAWWTPSWWFGHPTMDVYVNINTPVDRSGDTWTSVDVDLDVIRWSDGGVEIVDRDEFEAHRLEYGYPADLVQAAEAAAAEVLGQVTAGGPPWDGVAARSWRDWAERDPR